MFSKEIFSQRLHALREDKGTSRQELADELNMTYFSVAKMENAERAASIETLWALADYFDVSLDYLVGRSDDSKHR